MASYNVCTFIGRVGTEGKNRGTNRSQLVFQAGRRSNGQEQNTYPFVIKHSFLIVIPYTQKKICYTNLISMTNTNDTNSLPFDATLTRKNAMQRGYEWVCDLFTNKRKNLDTMTLSLVDEDEYILGCCEQCQGILPKDYTVWGLYRPIKTNLSRT